MRPAHRIVGLEVERTEIDRVGGRQVRAVKRHAKETVLDDIFPTCIESNDTSGEREIFQQYKATAAFAVEVNGVGAVFGDQRPSLIDELPTSVGPNSCELRCAACSAALVTAAVLNSTARHEIFIL